MIQSVNFDFKDIENKFNKTNKKISFKSKNMINLKNNFMTLTYLSLIISFFIFIVGILGIIVGVYFNKINLNNIILELLKLTLLSIIMTILLTIVITTLNPTSRLSFINYYKLKKISENKYETYSYTADIDSFYKLTSIGYRSSYKKNSGRIVFEKKFISPKKNILVIDEQKIYIDDNLYNEIKKDKKITLYFVKNDEDYILFDYKRVL